jgi:hypothetical protein
MTAWATIDADCALVFGATDLLAYLFICRMTISILPGLPCQLLMSFGSGIR